MIDNYVLWSTTPLPASEWIVQRMIDQKTIPDGHLRLVVLQTPLEVPQAGEVRLLRDQFSVAGVSVEAVDPGLQTRDDAFCREVIDVLRNAHVIIATGGSPERMVSVLHDTPALVAIQEVVDRGGWVGGGSAGAMAFGVGMPGMQGEAIPFLNQVPLVVAPHFGNYPLDPWQNTFPGQIILGIPDTGVAIIESGSIISAGRVPIELLNTTSGITTPLAPGEGTPLPRRS
jgi:hypothetical protein